MTDHTDPVLRRLAEANPAPADTQAPTGAMTADALLDVIEERSGTIAAPSLGDDRFLAGRTRRSTKLALARARLLGTERSPTMDTQLRPESRQTSRPPRWRFAAVAFVAVIAVGAIAGVGLLVADDRADEVVQPSSSNAVPAIGFDGILTTYTGPLELVTGELTTFVLKNNSEKTVAFAAALVKEDWTLEEAREHEFQVFSMSTPDPWMSTYRVIANVDPGETTITEWNVPSLAFELYVWVWDGSRGYHVEWVDVVEGE